MEGFVLELVRHKFVFELRKSERATHVPVGSQGRGPVLSPPQAAIVVFRSLSGRSC